MSEQTLEVLEVAQSGCFELATATRAQESQLSNASPVASFPAHWPTSPGAVRQAADGKLEALHFAPGRWLLPDPSADLLAAIADQSSAMLMDVEGKWQRRSLRGSGAMRLLAAAGDVETMLAGRDCAALSLFACPAIVARGRGSIELWVHSSYARFLDEQFASALARVGRRLAP